MTITFVVGSLPSQVPANDYIQDSLFRARNEVGSVVYNGVPFILADYDHQPTEWRLYFGFTMSDGDEIQVSIN